MEGLLDAAVVEVMPPALPAARRVAGWRCVSGPEGRRDRARGFSPGLGATSTLEVPEGRREPPEGWRRDERSREQALGSGWGGAGRRDQARGAVGRRREDVAS
jgi:hypothetical protein